MFKDLAGYSFKNVFRKKLRSGLTIIGIIIGIASIVLLISLGLGLDKEIRYQLTRFGTNYIVVMPGKGFELSTSGPPSFNGALYDDDANALKTIQGVDSVTGLVMLSSVPVSFKGEKLQKMVTGVGWSVYGKWTESIAGYESGSPLDEGDVGGAVIGYKVAHDFFDKEVRVGSTLNIQGKDFKVKGIFKKVGDISGDFDDAIYIDIKAARELQGSTFEKNRVLSIFVLADKDADISKIAEQANQKLLDRHHVTEENKDFNVMTADDMLAQVGSITALLSLFLTGIAAISLLVGGIGIANTMFTSVVERTQEIGILKSVGASTNSILQIFLVESALIGFIGGLLGVAFGVAAMLVLQNFGVPIDLRFEVLAFALFFAVIVGTVSGYFPARQAACLQPLEALRRE